MDIAQELLAAAKDLMEAGRLRDAARDDSSLLVTAAEMEQYCPDCAGQIRRGEMEITRGELREMLEDHNALRASKTAVRRWRPGERVEVLINSGIDSGKQGVVVNPREVRTDGRGIPTNVDGAYKPVDWRKESAVRLDDGTLITMFNDRLRLLRMASRDDSKMAYSHPVLSEPFRVGRTTWRISFDHDRGTWRAEWRQGINWQDQADWDGAIPKRVGRAGVKFWEEQKEKMGYTAGLKGDTSLKPSGMKSPRNASVEDRVAARWETLPEGWTDESREKFWDSLTGEVQHKVTKCIREMEGKVSDPGAFCASLARQIGYEF